MKPAASVAGGLAALLECCLLAGPTAAQLTDLQPGRNFTAQSNFGAAQSKQVDPGDADLDGDFDLVVGNGDEVGLQVQRIYINNGMGGFSDETAARFAGFPLMKARDIEFVDVEDDGDLDVFVADFTTGALPGAVSRLFINLGAAQRGTVGYFQEGTNEFWGALVSVPESAQVFGGDSGPFRDFACDCEFGDLDDDGDTDLLFGTYGPAFDAIRDSRVFLNDGEGVFNELWPWANPTADTKWRAPDVELADLDGDFDLDLVTAGLLSMPRAFVNNHAAPVGAQPFQDITQHALVDGGALASQNYEVEFADVDGDGDFDLWLDNQVSTLHDRLFRNDGPDAGGFGFTRMDGWIKNEPQGDEEDADFGDYDNDGDLDVFIANFSGTNALYQGSLAQGLDPDSQGLYHRTGVSSGLAPNHELPSNFNGGTSLDGEWFDADGDGDLDIVLANASNQGNWLFRNVLGVPDTHAPELAAVTVQADKPNGSETVIHAAVRDNTPLQWHRYYDAELVYAVDGAAPQSVSMFAQGGQQFRGVIPGQLEAVIEYHVEVTDVAGNSGVSETHSFVQGVADAWADLGSGLAGVAGIPSLMGSGPLTAGSAGSLTLSSAKPSAICALFVSIASTPAPFKCGTLVPVPVAIQLTLVTNPSGALPLAWGAWPSGLSGASLYFQCAIADGVALCGTSLSNAIRGDVP